MFLFSGCRHWHSRKLWMPVLRSPGCCPWGVSKNYGCVRKTRQLCCLLSQPKPCIVKCAGASTFETLTPAWALSFQKSRAIVLRMVTPFRASQIRFSVSWTWSLQSGSSYFEPYIMVPYFGKLPYRGLRSLIPKRNLQLMCTFPANSAHGCTASWASRRLHRQPHKTRQ